MKKQMDELRGATAANSNSSYAEFPYDLLELLRCSRDSGQLMLVTESRSGSFGLIDGILRCETCGTEYRIEDGIARMIVGNLAPEDEHEIALRNREYEEMPEESFVPPKFGWRSLYSDYLEIPAHLEELSPLEGRTVVETGCGDGRYTILMAQQGAQVLAVDFSINALRKIAARLPSGDAPTTYKLPHPVRTGDLRGQVGLVQADASQFSVAPCSFDRALSCTPLDSREQRMAMFRTVANGLRDDGRYLACFEYDDLPRRLLGKPVARRYSANGIFIEHFAAHTIQRELAPFFSHLNVRLVRPRIPFLHHLPSQLGARIGRALAALPILREFSEIILVRCEQPVRPAVEGVPRPGNKVVQALFYWYKGIRRSRLPREE